MSIICPSGLENNYVNKGIRGEMRSKQERKLRPMD